MAFVAIPDSHLLVPSWIATDNGNDTNARNISFSNVIDATGEQWHLIGKIIWEGGQPGDTKVISTVGGKIGWNCSGLTWATLGSVLRVGIQDVSLTAGPPPRGDGTWDTYYEYVQGTSSPTVSAWNTTGLMAVGSKTVTYGDLIAIVFDITVAGTDKVNMSGYGNFPNSGYPTMIAYTSGTTYSQVGAPNCIIVADDATTCWLDLAPVLASSGLLNYNVGTAGADEYGSLITLPVATKIDALWAKAGIATNTDTYQLLLYSDPLGTPTVLETLTVDGHQIGAANRATFVSGFLPAYRTLAANTQYAVTVRPLGTSNVSLSFVDVSVNAHLASHPWGKNCYTVKRLDNTGVFTAVDTRRVQCGVRVSHIDDGAGGAGGMRYKNLMHGNLA